MAVDYDLTILGGSAAARYAAAAAASLRARVALIEPAASPGLDGAIAPDLQPLLWQQVSRATRMTQHLPLWGLPGSEPIGQFSATQALGWGQTVTEVQAEWRSLPNLAAAGVDVIVGQGEFIRRPRLGVAVNGRSWRSRAYLLAPAARAAAHGLDHLGIEGLATIPYLTLDQLGGASLPTPLQTELPAELMIIGGDPRGLPLAQALARSGWQITLIVNSPHLLPAEDEATARLIQAQLETDGVRVMTQTAVTQVRQLEGKIWVQAGHRALAVDGLVLAMGPQLDLSPLNLAAAGLQVQPNGLTVNARLQTRHRRIYACLGSTGGYPEAHIRAHEAAIALKNALFCPRWSIDYGLLPRWVSTDPELAAVGLTEAEARQRYGKSVVVQQQSYKTLSKAQIRAETTGLCKLMLRPNGQIVGAHLVGPEASEVIGAIALAMRYRIPIGGLAQVSMIDSSYSHILQQAAQTWHQQWGDRYPGWGDRLESWFELCRAWSR